MAVPFLTAQLGASARLAVEIAWGANLTAASSTWAWTDITSDVRAANGIRLRHGRSDEASTTQPASCTLTLANTTGAYSLGGQSPNWPYVRQSTPVRVRVDPADGSGYRELFTGYADSWQPSWNQAGTVAEVTLTASGILRRLAQNTSPVLSSLRRKLTSDVNVVAYWPLEEGSEATQALSAIPGHPPMAATGDVNFGSNTSFASTERMPVLRTGGSLAGTVPTYTHTGEWQVRVLVVVPDSGQGMADAQPIFRVYTSSAQVARIDFLYGTVNDGAFAIRVYSSTGTLVNAAVYVNQGLNGDLARFYLTAKQNGSNVDFVLGRQHLVANDAIKLSQTVTGATLGPVTSVELNPGGVHNGIALGQPVVQTAITNVFTDYGELTAFAGEQGIARFRRLCSENGIEHSEFGDGVTEGTVTETMGPQRPDTLLALLRDTEVVDRGLIYDGLGNAGLTRRGRRNLENRILGMTIDVAAGELAGILEPVHDDQARVNKAIVTRKNGTTAAAEDVTGPLGTANVGVYDTSLTVPCASDEAPPYYAQWLVHLGTVEGYRYPTVGLDFVATPNLIPAWTTAAPGRRILVTNISSAAPQHPNASVELLVQGYEQTLTPHSWTARLNCSPFDPWAIGVAATDAGDTGAYVMRLDATGSTLGSAVSSGATALSVTTQPRWTTNLDDFPLEIEVGGLVLAVSGISAPFTLSGTEYQTFTVSGVTKSLTAGLPVTVHNPHFLGL